MRRWLLLLLLVPGNARAQEPEPRVHAPIRAARPAPPPAPLAEALRTPGGAFAASLILPGAGQAALGLKRWVVYGALEVGFWAVHLEAAADVRRLSTAYRDLAWEAARVPAGANRRVEGTWGYYETLGQYVRSGRYDADAGAAGLQPETDPATYNGSVWELARGLFLPGGQGEPGSDGYDEAVAYYREHAAGPDFLWSWEGRGDAVARYRGLIRDADAEARVRSAALGAVLANHLVSAADALVVARLRGDSGVRLQSRLIPTPGALRWRVGLRIPMPD